MEKIKTLSSIHLGVIISSIATVLLTITAELYEPFKNLLSTVFTHHWIGKAVIVTLVFAIVSITFYKREMKNIKWWTRNTLLVIILTSVAIFIFYIFEFFG